VGVRGIRLAEGDEVISMSILRHEEIPPEERDAYLRLSAKRRRGGDEIESEEGETETEDGAGNGNGAGAETQLSEERYAELASREEVLLTITEDGYGKRSSAYDYRITGRGAQGSDNVTRRPAPTIAVFAVRESDQIILVTDGGMVIRTPVKDISFRRRRSGCVVVFKVGEGERVVSVAHLADAGENGAPADEEEGGGDAAAPQEGQQA
jgi:DNA gyrase subunit A